MGWLTKDKPRDTSALHAALTHGTLDDFLAVYEPAYVSYDGFSGASLLSLAVGNDVAIASRLLDDGADVTVHHPVHVLLGRADHDFDAEPALLERMLDLGADVNAVLPRFGTPLETIAGAFKYRDATLTPFYDVLLARPDLDVLAPGLDGRPVLVNLRKWSAKRADLVARCEALLTERGIPVPPA